MTLLEELEWRMKDLGWSSSIEEKLSALTNVAEIQAKIITSLLSPPEIDLKPLEPLELPFRVGDQVENLLPKAQHDYDIPKGFIGTVDTIDSANGVALIQYSGTACWQKLGHD